MHLHPYKNKSPRVLHRIHPHIWMQGPDNFKTATKETGGNRNVVLMENVTNLIDYKKNQMEQCFVFKITHEYNM